MGRVEDYIIQLVSVAVFPIVWAIIWTRYFKKSELVRSTFTNKESN